MLHCKILIAWIARHHHRPPLLPINVRVHEHHCFACSSDESKIEIKKNSSNNHHVGGKESKNRTDKQHSHHQFNHFVCLIWNNLIQYLRLAVAFARRLWVRERAARTSSAITATTTAAEQPNTVQVHRNKTGNRFHPPQQPKQPTTPQQYIIPFDMVYYCVL